MKKNILIIQGHPDNSRQHFCHVVGNKYESAARSAGHTVKQLNIAGLDFPLLSSKEEFDTEQPCSDIQSAQNQITWADHVVVIYPLWLGDMPALVKAFWEQVLRPDFALSESKDDKPPKKLLKGKSARIFVTMGMPAAIYRWYFKAHTVKSLKRNILSFCGFKPVNFTLIGGVDEGNKDQLYYELSNASHLGRDAA